MDTRKISIHSPKMKKMSISEGIIISRRLQKLLGSSREEITPSETDETSSHSPRVRRTTSMSSIDSGVMLKDEEMKKGFSVRADETSSHSPRRKKFSISTRHKRTNQKLAEWSPEEIMPNKSTRIMPEDEENQSNCHENNHVDISARQLSNYDNTGPIILCITVQDVNITYEDIDFIAEKIESSTAEMLEIEFCDCKLAVGHLTRLCNTTNNVKSKIKTLAISIMEGIDELIETICSIVKKFKISELSLVHDELKDGSTMLLRKHLQKYKVDSLEHLDVSYNEDISPDGYRFLGQMMLLHSIVSLKAFDCNVTDEKLKNLFYVLQGGRKFKKLSIGCNTDLTTKGFRNLGRFVSENVLKSLNLTGCNFSHETLDAFLQYLKRGKLKELDVSYNSTIESDAALVPLLINSGVEKLSLAGWSLNKDHLIPLSELNSGHKMNILNMRDNKSIGPSMTKIAQLARKLKLDELNISDCALSGTELQSFRNSLGGYKLKCLHLGDHDREPDADYMEEIRRILTNVEEKLYIRFFKLGDAQRSVLQNSSVEIMLTVGSVKERIRNEKKYTTSTTNPL